MDRIIVFIICELCNKRQEFHGQYACDNCRKPFSPESIAGQLLAVGLRGKLIIEKGEKT